MKLIPPLLLSQANNSNSPAKLQNAVLNPPPPKKKAETETNTEHMTWCLFAIFPVQRDHLFANVFPLCYLYTFCF